MDGGAASSHTQQRPQRRAARQGAAPSALPSLAALGGEQPINRNRQALKAGPSAPAPRRFEAAKGGKRALQLVLLHLCVVPVISDPRSSPSRLASSPKPNAPTCPFGRRDCGAVTPVTGFIVAPWPYTAIVFPVPAASVAGDYDRTLTRLASGRGGCVRMQRARLVVDSEMTDSNSRQTL